jgi:hypothetical protein
VWLLLLWLLLACSSTYCRQAGAAVVVPAVGNSRGARLWLRLLYFEVSGSSIGSNFASCQQLSQLMLLGVGWLMNSSVAAAAAAACCVGLAGVQQLRRTCRLFGSSASSSFA